MRCSTRTLRWAWMRLKNRHRDEPRLAVIAYGKLGGKELGYGSDLDVVFLYDDSDEADPTGRRTCTARFVRKLITWLTLRTPAGQLFDIDTALRPNGNSGLLVTSITSFERYQQGRGSNTAWTWEHQALTRARFCAGCARSAPRFDAVRAQVLGAPRDGAALAQRGGRDARTGPHGHPMPAGVFDVKHSPGGMMDAEFAVQYLVLAHADRHRRPGRTTSATSRCCNAPKSHGLLPPGVGQAAAAGLPRAAACTAPRAPGRAADAVRAGHAGARARRGGSPRGARCSVERIARRRSIESLRSRPARLAGGRGMRPRARRAGGAVDRRAAARLAAETGARRNRGAGWSARLGALERRSPLCQSRRHGADCGPRCARPADRVDAWAWFVAWPLTHLGLLLQPSLLHYGGLSGRAARRRGDRRHRPGATRVGSAPRRRRAILCGVAVKMRPGTAVAGRAAPRRPDGRSRSHPPRTSAARWPAWSAAWWRSAWRWRQQRVRAVSMAR